MAINIKDKIAKLLALAESPNENEAKAALLKARELMAEHKLRPEDVKKAKKEKVIRKVLDITCTAMTNPWAASLSAVIAEHYCCRAYRYRSAGSKKNKIGLVGLEEDFEIAQRIVIYAHECVMAGIKAQFVRDPKALQEPTARSATPMAGGLSGEGTRLFGSRKSSTRNGAL